MPIDLPTYQIVEQASGSYTAAIVGNDRVTLLPGSTLTTLQLTLYVIKQDGTDEILNGRNQQNVLNLNNVQVLETPLTRTNGTQYNLIWTVQPGDTTIIEDFLHYERHLALFEWAWANGRGKAELILNVRNLRRVG